MTIDADILMTLDEQRAIEGLADEQLRDFEEAFLRGETILPNSLISIQQLQKDMLVGILRAE